MGNLATGLGPSWRVLPLRKGKETFLLVISWNHHSCQCCGCRCPQFTFKEPGTQKTTVTHPGRTAHEWIRGAHEVPREWDTGQSYHGSQRPGETWDATVAGAG